jgi:hypothetical protein
MLESGMLGVCMVRVGMQQAELGKEARPHWSCLRGGQPSRSTGGSLHGMCDYQKQRATVEMLNSKCNAVAHV